MEDKFLYRYISFETFVGMVQKQALTFVLPSVWDDSHEDTPFYQFVEKQQSSLTQALFLALHNKIYAQCWSELEESDAMWRIYSYSNRALRIKVKTDKIMQLDKVNVRAVMYSDATFNCKELNEESLISSLSYKRTAFCHEKEVRLISLYRYLNIEDAELHAKAYLFINDHPDSFTIFNSIFPDMEPDEKIIYIQELLNIGINCKKTKDISYAHIPNFIEGVMVHPLEPEWYVDVVREFCKRNNIPFEGKSNLYP